MHSLFYNDRKKVITKEVSDLLGPSALAFWIMSDGWNHNKGVTIATNSFSDAENELLISALKEKFALDCRLIRDHAYPSIHISFRSLSELQKLIVPFMHSSMLYKIYL